MYIADNYNDRIRKVTVSTSIITTIAGTGNTGYSGDNGPATSAALNRPWGVTVDTVTGDVYICDYFNNVVRKVTISTGIITTIVGGSGATGLNLGSYSGDGGLATSATLNGPVGIALDSTGNLLICDRYNHRIRKVAIATDIITTIVGSGMSSYSGDNGVATAASINQPLGIAADSSGTSKLLNYLLINQ